ncbi:MAG: hypothetical protein NUV97_03765 [archaeon]|nr:hypothetical protein [archaeon]MCR4323865.1 hypothetical protein [Nanoarchaeota archaeon]
MDSRRGTQGWTMQKLITIILLVLVMALVIYGITIGGFGPLVDRAEGAFNEVLIFLGIKDGPPSVTNCFKKFLFDVPGGNELLDSLGLDGEVRRNVKFEYCENVCTLNDTSLGDYRRLSDSYEIFGEGLVYNDVVGSERKMGWHEYEDYLKDPDGIKSSEFYWELYDQLVKAIIGESKENSMFVDRLYSSRFSKDLTFYGNGGGLFDKPSSALWKEGEWIVMGDGEKVYTGLDDRKAIETFKSYVDDAYDDKVYYQIRDPVPVGGSSMSNSDYHGESIQEIFGGTNVEGDEGEFDHYTKTEALIDYVTKKKIEFSEAVKPSSEEVAKLRSLVESKKVIVDEEVYDLGIKVHNGFPLIIISGDKEYALAFSPRVKLNLLSGTRKPAEKFSPYHVSIPLNFYSWEIVSLDDGERFLKPVGSWEDYMLFENDFKLFRTGRLIKDFLDKTCGFLSYYRDLSEDELMLRYYQNLYGPNVLVMR